MMKTVPKCCLMKVIRANMEHLGKVPNGQMFLEMSDREWVTKSRPTGVAHRLTVFSAERNCAQMLPESHLNDA